MAEFLFSYNDLNHKVAEQPQTNSTNIEDIPIMNKTNVINGIYLLILAVCGNFVAETLGCKTRKLLTENMYAKNIVIILIIYFALGFVNDKNNTPPHNTMIVSFIIWSFFLIFNKMNLYFTFASFTLITTLLVLKNYKEYYETKDKEKYKEDIAYIDNAFNNIYNANIFVIVAGFLLYFKKQYSEHSGDFSLITFIFGKTQCESIS